MGQQVIHHVVVMLVLLHHAVVGWHVGLQRVLHQLLETLLLALTKFLQEHTIFPNTEGPCKTPQSKQSEDRRRQTYFCVVKHSQQRKFKPMDKPACPTTCSHCCGFLEGIERGDEVPRFLCSFHALLCMGMEHVRPHTVIFQLTCHRAAFLCWLRFSAPPCTDGTSDFRLKSLNFYLMGARLHGNSHSPQRLSEYINCRGVVRL